MTFQFQVTSDYTCKWYRYEISECLKQETRGWGENHWEDFKNSIDILREQSQHKIYILLSLLTAS